MKPALNLYKMAKHTNKTKSKIALAKRMASLTTLKMKIWTKYIPHFTPIIRSENCKIPTEKHYRESFMSKPVMTLQVLKDGEARALKQTNSYNLENPAW